MSAARKPIAHLILCALAVFGFSACEDRTSDAPRVQTGGTPVPPVFHAPFFGAPGGGGAGVGGGFGDGQNGFDGSAGLGGVAGFGSVAGIGGIAGSSGVAGFGSVAGIGGVAGSSGVAGFGSVAGIGGGDFGAAGFGAAGDRAGNRAPVAAIEFDPPCLSERETLVTSISRSVDPDGDPLSCAWNMPAGIPDRAAGCAVPGIFFPDANESLVLLTVRDGRGGTSTTTRQIGPCPELAAGQAETASP